MAAKSYLDPTYEALAGQMEQRFGLPGGLLHNIITKGERSNADQVSEKGAKTVFQITPATRKAALEKWGVDAYLNSENAAEVAARVLKDSLNRNGGDVKEAVGEYHGGTDRQNWGPRTRAYVGRVTSTFDRVKAQREAEQPQAPSIAKVYEAYKADKLDPQARQEFEADVQSGAVLLPRGAKLDVADKPSGHVLPAGVVQAYNSHSEMSEGERAQLDKDIAAGLVQLPPGAKLQRPAARTGGEMAGMGLRGIAEGAGKLGDFALNPAIAVANQVYRPIGAVTEALGGTPEAPLQPNYLHGVAKAGADAIGLATPATDQEVLANALIEGGAQGLLTAGTGAALSGAKGMTGAVASELAAHPVMDTIASAASAGSSEVARQNGAGPVGQVLAGLAGGVPAAGLVATTERLATRFGPEVAKVVTEVPRAALLDEQGVLTEEGRELAARHGIGRDDLASAYDEAAKPEPAPRAAAEVMEPVAVAAQPKAVEPAAASGPVQAAQPLSAAARVADASSVGVDLTRGQALQDAGVQAAERDAAGVGGPDGQAVQAHFTAQKEQVRNALEAWSASVSDPNLSKTERGELVQAAVQKLRDQGKAGVTALYDRARELAQQAAGGGEKTEAMIRLDPEPLRATLKDLLIDETVPEATRKGLAQWGAKFGLLGEQPRHVPETGNTVVMVRNDAGELVRGPSFPGKVEQLDLSNAERFRAKLNDMFDPAAPRNPQEALKPILDDQIEKTSIRASQEGVGPVGEAFSAAREGFKAQKKTFEAGDVVHAIAEWKRGRVASLAPEAVIDAALKGGAEGYTNLRRLKAVLLASPTPESRGAWTALQGYVTGDIVRRAVTAAGDVTPAGLNRAIAAYGEKKLKVLLDAETFNSLMKVRRVVAATAPMPNTVNSSGSAYAVARIANRMLGTMMPALRLTGVGQLIDGGAALLQQGKQFAATREVAKGLKVTAEAVAGGEAGKVSRVGEYLAAFGDFAASTRPLGALLGSAGQAEGDHSAASR